MAAIVARLRVAGCRDDEAPVPKAVRALGPLDRGPTIAGYLGLLLMGGAYVSIGVMCSAFTRNSIVAFIVAFAISFALFLFGHIGQYMPQALQPLVAFLSKRLAMQRRH